MNHEPNNIERPLLAVDVAERLELSASARPLLRSDQTPQQFFAELARRELYADAIALAAHYLTPREAVWWGCLCAWQVIREQEQPQQAAALNAVVRWVQAPTDARRRAVFDASQSIGVAQVAGALGLAAFYTGGSISVAGQPHVDPPAELSARIVAGAVQLAATLVPPEYYQPCLRHFLQLAGEVSRGEAPWQTGDDKVSAQLTAHSHNEVEHARPRA